MKTRGQVAVAVISGVAVVIASLIGAVVTARSTVETATEGKIEAVRAEFTTQTISSAQRLATLEANQATTQRDVTEIKADVKAILRELK